nr:hypothetical protein [uncultured Flavobacterium sp.]
MKKTTIVLSTLLLISFSQTFAQISAQGVSGTGILTFYKSNSDKKANVVGSEYIEEEFKSARVNGGTQAFQIRFNAHTNVMEYKKDNENLILVKKNNTLFEFSDGKVYELISHTDKKGKETDDYLVVVKKDINASIYKLERVTFTEARPASNTYDTATPAQFKRATDTYFLKIKDVVTELPTKTKEYIKLFPSKEAEIKAYFKANKINFKDEADLIKLTTFLNSIA